MSQDKLEELKKLNAEQVKKSVNSFNTNFKKKKILCSVWLVNEGTRPKFVGSKKRAIGKTDFVVKGKRYSINYDFINEGKKYYEYNCDVRYANAPLSYNKLAENDARLVIANQADHMLIDGVVRVMMAKGGIPALWLLIAMIMTAVAIAGMMYFLSQYQTLTTTIEKNKTTIATLTEQNNIMKQQLAQFGIVT